MAERPDEPGDSHVYYGVYFDRDAFFFFRESVRHYQSLLQQDLDSVRDEPGLSEILNSETLKGMPISREQRRVEWTLNRFEQVFGEQGESSWDYDFSLSHGTARFLKSTGQLYLQHLTRYRDDFASRATVSKAILDGVDQQLARFAEVLELGVFSNATPEVLAAVRERAARTDPTAPQAKIDPPATLVAPIRIGSIEIRDPELRERCLDLLAQFESEGANHRLDTVLNEATRILEDRLRSLSNAADGVSGLDLVSFALGDSDPKLILSDITADQKAAHLLFRGVFGFVRNSVHHRLISDLQPQRVMQVLGMVDYLIFLAESAARPAPAGEDGV